MNIRRHNESLYGVIGCPIENSLIPILHNWALEALNLDATYLRWSVPAEKLGIFVASLRLLRIAGVSVMLPHKEAIISYLDGLTPVAEAVGAANTLYWSDGQLMGDNTEVAGFLAPLRDMEFDEALVLGAGGSARAVLAALNTLKVPKITVSATEHKTAGNLAAFFGCSVVSWADRLEVLREAGRSQDSPGPRLVVVNATPVGSVDLHSGSSPFSAADLALLKYPECALVYDLVYNPVQTQLLGFASQAGCGWVGGLPMLTTMGLEQVRRWYGYELQFGDALAVLEQELSGQHAAGAGA